MAQLLANAPGEITLQTVCDAIQGLKLHITEKIDPIQASLTTLQTSMNNLSSHVDELEDRVG